MEHKGLQHFSTLCRILVHEMGVEKCTAVVFLNIGDDSAEFNGLDGAGETDCRELYFQRRGADWVCCIHVVLWQNM